MEWFNIMTTATEPSGFVRLPESVIGHGFTLELHIAVGEGDRTIAYWMLDDDIMVAEVRPGLA
jgi:hypothetical protein